MRYASVCSGVEAASLAWEPLGWEPSWFSEIEPFPCAVLKSRFPSVQNLGDMTKIECVEREKGIFRYGTDGTVFDSGGRIDLLVGGTPCQSFSVAGTRKGLEGSSGLARHFVRLLEEMQPRWFVWENVPGCMSSITNGQRDFNFLIRQYAECGYSLAWRVLDAQYVRVDGFPRAVPQRRRRVFVVGHLGEDGRYPAEVLFEPSSLPRNTPPRRIAGKGSSGETAGGPGETVSENEDVICKNPSRNGETSINVAPTIKNRDYKDPPVIFQGIGFGMKQVAPTIDCCISKQIGNQNAEDKILLFGDRSTHPDSSCDAVSGPLEAKDGRGVHSQFPHEGKLIVVHGSQDPISNGECANAIGRNGGLENCITQFGDVAGTLTRRFDSSHNEIQIYGETSHPRDENGTQNYKVCDCAKTLNVFTLNEKRVEELVVSSGHKTPIGSDSTVCYENHGQDSRVKEIGNISPSINARSGTGGNNLPIVSREASSMVRRLTPTECERLMGFPDGWTKIPWRGRTAEECPDGPRYKACGNSMCVNVMRWIGERICLAEDKEGDCNV